MPTIRHDQIYRVGVNEDVEFTAETQGIYNMLVEAYTERYADLDYGIGEAGSSLEAGNPSPEFIGYENILGGTTDLEDFRGKYVYIDLWATWCYPCRAEIPFLKKLESDFHDRNIEFVSISLDKPGAYDKWREMVSDLNLSGTQLYANGNAFKDPFAKAYDVRFIPRFLLIGPDGKIVEADAPRPSERSMRNFLTSLGPKSGF